MSDEQFGPPKIPVEVHSFAELRDTGTLWYLNSMLHPRGFAVALHLDDDGNATGWSLVGNGREPIAFVTKEIAEDYGVDVRSPVDADTHFANFEALLERQRAG